MMIGEMILIIIFIENEIWGIFVLYVMMLDLLVVGVVIEGSLGY